MRQRYLVAGMPLGFVASLLLAGVSSASAGSPSLRNLTGVVVKVVDGDTVHVEVNGHVERVRYIGVNAPEVRHPTKGKQPGGDEATEVNRRLVERQTVRLELDVRERDRNGRLLAYVYVGDVMVNAELVWLGYAQVETVPPNVKHQELFLKLQREAREAGRGLWGR